MLSDSSLTNILTVSGVSQIRYRAYQQCCSRSALNCHFSWQDHPTSTNKETTLIKAYTQLIYQNIPCMWQLQPSTKAVTPSTMDTEQDNITLELWVFWFDDRHTGIIDANDLLKELDELRMGSFTWENVTPKNTHRSNACTLVSVVVEYKLFVKAIRNLILPYMLRKDILPLGEFFVFPPSYLESAVGEDTDTNRPSSLLCCTYNIYLASTNLIFQPNTRRIRLRSLSVTDTHSRAKVLLSPTGEQASLIPSRKSITHPFEKRLLQQWSAILQLPFAFLQSKNSSIPSLVPVRMSWGEVTYYPSRLVFLLTPTKQSPSAQAGMNSTMGYNHGLTEDIAQKWNREMWLEQLLSNQADKSKNRVDYWAYSNPRLHTTMAALDSLSASTMATPNSTDPNSPMMIQGGMLIKALNEPVLSSPLMASKSVATPSSPLPKDDGDFDNEKGFSSNNGDTPGGSNSYVGNNNGSAWRGSQTSLTDFVRQHFANGSMDDYASIHMNGALEMGTLAGSATTTPTSGSMMMVNTLQDGMMPTTDQTQHTTNLMHSQQQTSQTMPNVNYTSPLQMSYTAQESIPQQYMHQQHPFNEQQRLRQLQFQQQQEQEQQQRHQQQQQNLMSDVNQSQVMNDNMNGGGGTLEMNTLDALNTMVYDMSTPWGGDTGLDNLELDLDVTEEDFNFFESEPAKPATSSAAMPSTNVTSTATSNVQTTATIADMQSLDFFQMKHEENLSSDMILDTLDFPKSEQATTTTTTMASAGLDGLLTTPKYDDMVLDTPKQEIKVTGMATHSSLMDESTVKPETIETSTTSQNTMSTSISMSLADDTRQQQHPTPFSFDSEWPVSTVYGGGREQRLVPPSFAPLSLPRHVNDAKYAQGGKFTYTPRDDDDSGTMTTTMTSFSIGKPVTKKKQSRRKTKDRMYRPDYVPVVKKRRNKKKVDEANQNGHGQSATDNTMENPTALASAQTNVLDIDGDDVMNSIGCDNNNGNHSDSSGASASDSDSDSENDEVTSDSDDSMVQQLRDLKQFQAATSTPMKRVSSSTSTTASATPLTERIKENIAEDNESISRQSITSVATTTDIMTISSGPLDADNEEEEDLAHWLDRVSKARTIYLHRLIGDVRITHGGKRRYLLDRLDLDYDTPFATTVAPGQVHPDRYNEADDRSLHYLCQQAVLGGYPFTGGLAETSANGGEVAVGESTRVIIARRRDLVQHARGGASHVPCLPCDFDRVTQDFKSILGDIFDPKIAITDEPLPLNVTDFTSSVSVNGPLNVQQYYELSESNQIHSKYGKYQVKKRRPAEPNFDTLHSPDIVVSRHDEFIEGSPKMVDFWDKLRLEPYSPKKNISYFVVCPSNDELESAVQVFFKGLSTVYETCCLGTHHPGHIGAYRRGTVPVSLLPEESGESKQEHQMRSYMATCQQLGTSLGGVMAENVYIVIYMVNPCPHLSSNLELSRCYNGLMTAFEQARMQFSSTTIFAGSPATSRFPSEKTRARLIMQLVPIEHILRCTDFGSYTKCGLKEIAFSVYSKCPTIVDNRNKGGDEGKHAKLATPSSTPSPPPTLPVPSSSPSSSLTSIASSSTAEIYAPAFVLTKQIPDHITYSLAPSLSAPVILDQDATLHLAYGYSLDRRWMVTVWTDHRGELVEFAILRASARHSAPFVAVFEEAWKRTQEIASQADFVWTFVIVKLGLMFENELQAWIHVIPENKRTVVLSMDMESSLHVDTLDGQEEAIPYYEPGTPQTPQTPNVGPNHVSTPPPTPQQASSSATTPSSVTGSSKGNNNSIDTLEAAAATTSTKILLLNHRVAYSRKRQRVSEGVTLMDPISDAESWILPLASGYLIQLSKQGAPAAASEEQFGRAPCVVELHLVYNQTQHSAYTTLRDIIKRYYALSFVNVIPSAHNCLPLHIVLADRLWRLLLVVDY